MPDTLDREGAQPLTKAEAQRIVELNEARAMLRARRGAGGTPGGLGTFFVGLILAGAGLYLVLNQVTVTGSFNLFGFLGLGSGGGFGLTMLPLLIGIGTLFFNGKSVLGWLITILGSAMIMAAILMNMSIFFRPTSLFNTILMFGMLAAGLGMIFRSLRAYPSND